MITTDDIKRNIETVLTSIRKVNSSVKLLAVSKTFDTTTIAAAIEAGLSEFGESKIQEAEQKIYLINGMYKFIKWHFIGHLQSNKAVKAIKLFQCVQAVDSLRLAEKLSSSVSAGSAVEALLEVKVSDEDAKFGILPEKAAAIIEGIKQLPGISITGLMTMAPYSDNPEDARPYFKKAKTLFDELKRNSAGTNVTMETLSMGMSGDYIVAMQEGATMVRIGSGIFGKRQY
jgi:pyridoxal phosphate enzyme (YggS family)